MTLRLHALKPILLALILLAGCAPTAFFSTPNDVVREKALLYWNNGDTTTGEISVALETIFSANVNYQPSIEFTPTGKIGKQVIHFSDIRGYRIGSTYYALKNLDISVNGTYRTLFVKQLTPDSSKIHLYELHESGRGNATGESLYSYYLSLKSSGPLETINSKSVKIIPNFDLKMSEIVSDCPKLADKIRRKQDGYYLPFISFNPKKQPEVLLRIINEYNSCN